MSQFTFKQFTIRQDRCAMKVGTDGVLLGAWATGGDRILDIGTGTGLVALMMAQRFPNATVTGIEIDDAAATQATENVASSPFHERIDIEHCALQDFNPQSKYDAITCNPPFFEESLKCPNKTRNTARHTDTLPYSTLFEHCRDMLTDEGTLSIIIPADYLSRVQQECAYCSLFINETLYIKTTERKPAKRVLLAIGRHIKNSPRSSTAILMANAKRSEWYTQLTNDFYIR